MIKKYYQEFLTYTYLQRKGILWLSALLFMTIVCMKAMDYMESDRVIDFSQFENDKALNNRHASSFKDRLEENYTNEITNPDSPIRSFNPNSASDDDYLEMGLSPKQVSVIRNYITKGGKFKSKDDFKKMYCIGNSDYNRLSPYILIPEQRKEMSKKLFDKPKGAYIQKSDITLELNTADTVTLTQLHGIGTAYARRIIKYRDALGGFNNKEQLLEVYAFDSLHYNQIEEHITVNTDLIKKININIASFDDLKRHPYLKITIANALINYRKQHGNYKEVSDIKNLTLMNDGLYLKLAPYLSVN